MTSNEIKNKLNEITQNLNRGEFIYDLLLAHGISKTSVTRLKKGEIKQFPNVTISIRFKEHYSVWIGKNFL